MSPSTPETWGEDHNQIALSIGNIRKFISNWNDPTFRPGASMSRASERSRPDAGVHFRKRDGGANVPRPFRAPRNSTPASRSPDNLAGTVVGFLRLHRGALFDDAFQEELASVYRQIGAGRAAHPPAFMAMVVLLQAYTKTSDAEAVQQCIVDLRWQMVLDCLGATEPAFSQGAPVIGELAWPREHIAGHGRLRRPPPRSCRRVSPEVSVGPLGDPGRPPLGTAVGRRPCRNRETQRPMTRCG